jgi:hypothetical protein
MNFIVTIQNSPSSSVEAVQELIIFLLRYQPRLSKYDRRVLNAFVTFHATHRTAASDNSLAAMAAMAERLAHDFTQIFLGRAHAGRDVKAAHDEAELVSLTPPPPN